MKNFLQNLLIFFALCLCALIAFQWVRETDLRKHVQSLTTAVQDKSQAIVNLEAAARRDHDEIQRLDGERKRLDQTVKSNFIQITGLSRALEKATNDLKVAEISLTRFKDAYERTSENLTNANNNIIELNAKVKKMADDATQVVNKYKDLLAKYDDLAAQWNKQQAELAKQATNAPPKK
jgi:chromosome segregation ATPase